MMDARDTFARALMAEDAAPVPAGAPVAESDPPSAPAPLPQADVEHGVVDPRTGEFIRPADEATDRLAGLQLELIERIERFKAWQATIDGELRNRLEAEGRKMAVVGDYELAIEGGRSREWFPDDLELVVQSMLDRGTLNAGEVTGLIQTVRKVDGNLARRLLDRTSGEVRAELESCYRWKRGTQHVRISRAPDLADALPQGGAP